MKIQQMKRPRIKPYGFAITVAWGETAQFGLLEIIEWVILNIGSVLDGKWITRGLGTNELKVYFDEETDAIAFKLKWI